MKAFRINVTARIRGLERSLNKRGALGFLINFASNFADITDMEFNFRELILRDLAVPLEKASERIT